MEDVCNLGYPKVVIRLVKLALQIGGSFLQIIESSRREHWFPTKLRCSQSQCPKAKPADKSSGKRTSKGRKLRLAYLTLNVRRPVVFLTPQSIGVITFRDDKEY